MRYDQLLELVKFYQPRKIVEVGTWFGLQAIAMAEAAYAGGRKDVEYWGFDLFEDGSDESDAAELNVKARPTQDAVFERLKTYADSVKERGLKFEFALVKGNSRETLPEKIPGLDVVDFAFIDGGHSVETVRRDWNALKKVRVVALDDYYSGEGIDTKKFGCNNVVKKIGAVILPSSDKTKQGSVVHLAVKINDETLPPLPNNVAIAGVGPNKKLNLIVQTKNCVPSEEIKANVRANTPKFPAFIPYCEKHGEDAVMVSAGPSFKENFSIIAEMQGKGSKVFCVKHSHDELIDAGIVPFGCILLDPRGHVQEFVDKPHKDVAYFVASMCSPIVVDHLLAHKVKLWGYHALVGAGETECVPKDHLLVSGGSTSATRGIMVLHMLGFRTFDCFGYDSCYSSAEGLDMKKTRPDGSAYYFEVEVGGRKFLSDAELIAQSQDVQKILQHATSIDIKFHGDGMIPHVWSMIRTKDRASFHDTFALPRNAQ